MRAVTAVHRPWRGGNAIGNHTKRQAAVSASPVGSSANSTPDGYCTKRANAVPGKEKDQRANAGLSPKLIGCVRHRRRSFHLTL
jgi:hypothetical protein